MDFYDKFLLLCADKGVSPSRAAIEMKMNKSTVSVWKSKKEKGEEVIPSSPNINKIARYFKVSSDFLLGKTENSNEYILMAENYPDVLKPFVIDGVSTIVIAIDHPDGSVSQKKLKQLTLEELKDTYVKFDSDHKNPLNEMLSLLPFSMRNSEISLYDALDYIGKDAEIMQILKNSGYNEQGELTIQSDSFARAVLEKDIKDALREKGEIRITADGQEKPAIKDDGLNKPKLPSNIFSVPKMRPIPVVGTIRAGIPILAEENIEGYEYDDAPEDKDCFFLRVKGDSMVNARICDGDLVLIKQQPCADDGQIVACLVNGDEATLKRFYRQKDMVILKPENPAYNPIVVPCADFESGYARIIGIVTEVKFKV